MKLIFILVLVIIIAAVIVYFISIYNSLIRLKHNIDKSYSNIDVLLKQRHDELKKLLNVVKGYMNFEESLLTKITEARAHFYKAKTPEEKAGADNLLEGALKSIFAVSENYPDLKANQNFIKLQERVSQLENSIADRREFYNDSVNTFNIRIEQIPYVFIAAPLKYSKRSLFKVKEEEKQDIDMVF